MNSQSGVCVCVCLEERNPKVFFFLCSSRSSTSSISCPYTYICGRVPAIQEAWKSNLTKQKIILVLASCRKDVVSFQSQDSWLLLYLPWSGDGSSLGNLSWKLPRWILLRSSFPQHNWEAEAPFPSLGKAQCDVESGVLRKLQASCFVWRLVEKSEDYPSPEIPRKKNPLDNSFYSSQCVFFPRSSAEACSF